MNRVPNGEQGGVGPEVPQQETKFRFKYNKKLTALSMACPVQIWEPEKNTSNVSVGA